MSALERLKGWETMMLALLVAIIVFNSVGSPYFLSVGNFVNLFQLSIEKSIVALTMALIIIGGEIDLSVASVMGLSACVTAWTFHEGAPMPLAILIALAAGIRRYGANCIRGWFAILFDLVANKARLIVARVMAYRAMT